MADVKAAETAAPLDLLDERLRRGDGWRSVAGGLWRRVRSGDLGVLPIVLGLVVIWTVFQSLNSVFLSSANLVNLLMESASVGIIALGVVCVLLVGQIDLSVGSVSGLSAALTAVTFVSHGWPLPLSMAAALGAGALIGVVYAQMVTRLGVPSFVATLAGLLSFLGIQLWLLGDTGAINLPFESDLVHFAQLAFLPEWLSYVLVVVAAGWLFATGYGLARTRRAAGLSARSTSLLVARSAAVLLGLGFAVWYLNRARGVGWLFVSFVVLVLLLHYALTRTGWGRSVFAVGGNAEAARRAGINVRRVYTSVFVLCSTLAALGGMIAAARLAAANQATGAGDVNLNAIAAAVIGGTSLFGGRGSAFSALLGILVIQSISNGLTLLDLDSSFRFIITGLVLALAVTLDSVARRSRVAHGRAA
ncbi:simple sugar transport system permease protein/D-xylose transport system permease protein [Streptomyces zhaozhouensis]|uniref:Xylose transport system permease protein XylH n=1 Tax=Streptomyces zhaozhouensis TaxID=1300267 RepID=A0A286DUM1_9ACTN|nr:ABC transporter permease [Streptomyces zhaozhouensis]SOD62303.1 simple sugar transport system permease protein/D-xylose transport system permease protein [Streptomyces zhaozhouensis]